MVYAYDQWAQMPTKDLFDTQMMLASVQAAKDMYEKGLAEMKDFRKEYGDLLFTNDAYQDWYNENFDFGGFVDSLYKSGIDPVRSQEGRTAIRQYIASRKYGDLARRRAWDANMLAYKQSISKNMKQYDPQFETWRIGGDINNWGDRPFTESSIVPYENLQEMTLPSFSTIKPHLLTSQEAIERLGEDYNPLNSYTGVTRQDMEDVMGQWMPGVRNNILFQYQRELAKQDLQREGYTNPTEDQIDRMLIDNAITSNAGIMTPLAQEADQWELLKKKHAYDVALENLKFNNEAAIAAIKAGNKDDSDGNYLHVLSNQAASALLGLDLTLLANRDDLQIDVSDTTDPAEIQSRIMNTISNNRGSLFKDFLQSPKFGYDGQHSVADLIMSLKEGTDDNSTTDVVNSILSNFATNGDVGMNEEYLMRSAGYTQDSNGVWKGRGESSKVVSAHELLGNIIKYSGGDNYTIKSQSTPIHRVTKDQLVDKLERVAGGYEKKSWYNPNQLNIGNVVAERDKVVPDFGEKNTIIAPDKDGRKYIWIKVTSVGGALQDDYSGCWMKTPIEIGANNQPTTDSRAIIYGAGVRERHTYGNAGVSQEWNNQR